MAERIFVDTAPLIDLLTKAEGWEKASDFLDEHKTSLCTSVIVLNELKFKLLMHSAIKILGHNKKFEIIKFIKSDKSLSKDVYKNYIEFYANIEDKIKIFGAWPDYEGLACALAIKYGLLPNDALILATMIKNNVRNIFTYDEDFKKIEGIKVIEP